MTNHCSRCGRVFNEGIIPKEMEDDSEIYSCGVCNKCNEEYYDPDNEFLDQNTIRLAKKFIKERIKKYGN